MFYNIYKMHTLPKWVTQLTVFGEKHLLILVDTIFASVYFEINCEYVGKLNKLKPNSSLT